MAVVRSASHAGSWYSDNSKELANDFEYWLQQADTERTPNVRAVIGPHAGYSYCGPTTAYAYKQINPEQVKRVFLLGPSHHVALRGIALSACDAYDTPFGQIPVDKEVVNKLAAAAPFKWMPMEMDEADHCLEMHLPILKYVMGRQEFEIVPMIVGNTTPDVEEAFAKVLAPYFLDEKSLFVISSDFCHWGERFGYMQYDTPCDVIGDGIEQLDRRGMAAIESGDVDEFYRYLDETDNTICGRHPISILMQILRLVREQQEFRVTFNAYAQSSRVKTKRESSVSYAAAAVTALQ